MIRHSMNVVKKAVAVLNPRKIPVITFDHPLFTIANCKSSGCGQKSLKKWKESFVEMLGGQHIKMALLKALGGLFEWQWLDVSSSTS